MENATVLKCTVIALHNFLALPKQTDKKSIMIVISNDTAIRVCVNSGNRVYCQYCKWLC